MSQSSFIPLNDRILIRAEQNEKTKSGLLLSGNSERNTRSGMVLSVSSEITDVPVGSLVFFAGFTAVEIMLEEETLFILKKEDILGIINK